MKIESFIGKITAVGVILYVLGLIIVNTYINEYNLYNYEIIKPQSIIIGTVFVVFHIFNILLFVLFIDFENLKYGIFSVILNLIRIFIRIVLLSTVISYLLVFSVVKDITINFLDTEIVINYTIQLGIALAMSLVIFLILKEYYLRAKEFDEPHLKHEAYLYNISEIIISLIAIIIFIILSNDDSFMQIFNFEKKLFFIVAPLLYYIIVRDSKKVKYKERFDDYVSNKSFKLGNNYVNSNLDSLVSVLYLAVLLMHQIYFYSSVVYKELPSKYGGGEYPVQSFVVKNDTITGKTIFMTKDKFYVLTNDTIINIYKQEDLNTIINR